MTTTTDTPSLADRLAIAEAEAVEPRNRVSRLETALTKAVSAGDYDQAAQLQAELVGARENWATADASVAALRDAAARIERQRAEDSRLINEARQRDQAERDIEAAQADEAKRTGQMRGALAAMWSAIDAAQQHLRSAQAFESAVTAARHAQNEARQRRGDWGNDPGPTAARANEATLLADQDQLVSALARWSR